MKFVQQVKLSIFTPINLRPILYLNTLKKCP